MLPKCPRQPAREILTTLEESTQSRAKVEEFYQVKHEKS